MTTRHLITRRLINARMPENLLCYAYALLPNVGIPGGLFNGLSQYLRFTGSIPSSLIHNHLEFLPLITHM